MSVRAMAEMAVAAGVGQHCLRWLLPTIRDWSSEQRDAENEVATKIRLRGIFVERYVRGESDLSDAEVSDLLGLGEVGPAAREIHPP